MSVLQGRLHFFQVPGVFSWRGSRHSERIRNVREHADIHVCGCLGQYTLKIPQAGADNSANCGHRAKQVVTTEQDVQAVSGGRHANVNEVDCYTSWDSRILTPEPKGPGNPGPVFEYPRHILTEQPRRVWKTGLQGCHMQLSTLCTHTETILNDRSSCAVSQRLWPST